ncbi:MAG: uracil-DNA glycosylase family protein, partial [Burkholderiales bacterium]|nr:uracil-DNA glycosylase family protein [Burkholderiales bacterium]
PAWRAPLLAHLKRLELTLAIGQYAVRYHFPDAKGSLAAAVAAWRRHWPRAVPLPHPSPRNNLWLRRNPWFEREVLPQVRRRLRELI